MSNQAKELDKAISELYAREAAYEKAIVAAAESDGAYRIAKAKAYLNTEGQGTAQHREAMAVEATEKELLQRLKDQAVAAFTKEKLEDCRAAMFARQTILSAEAKVHELTKYKIA